MTCYITRPGSAPRSTRFRLDYRLVRPWLHNVLSALVARTVRARTAAVIRLASDLRYQLVECGPERFEAVDDPDAPEQLEYYSLIEPWMTQVAPLPERGFAVPNRVEVVYNHPSWPAHHQFEAIASLDELVAPIVSACAHVPRGQLVLVDGSAVLVRSGGAVRAWHWQVPRDLISFTLPSVRVLENGRCVEILPGTGDNPLHDAYAHLVDRLAREGYTTFDAAFTERHCTLAVGAAGPDRPARNLVLEVSNGPVHT